jgi:hypothetical protein
LEHSSGGYCRVPFFYCLVDYLLLSKDKRDFRKTFTIPADTNPRYLVEPVTDAVSEANRRIINHYHTLEACLKELTNGQTYKSSDEAMLRLISQTEEEFQTFVRLCHRRRQITWLLRKFSVTVDYDKTANLADSDPSVPH